MALLYYVLLIVYRIVRVAVSLLCMLSVRAQSPLSPPPGKLSLLMFVLADCPISRRLTPEFGRICTDYAARGVACTMVFVDPDTTAEQTRQYLKDFSIEPMPSVVDSRHRLVRRTGATVTPEVGLLDSSSKLLYLGRIDDSHVSWTRSRPATRRDLREALNAALAGRPVPHPRTDAVGCYISPLPEAASKE